MFLAVPSMGGFDQFEGEVGISDEFLDSFVVLTRIRPCMGIEEDQKLEFFL